MSARWLAPSALFDGDALRSGVAVLVEDGEVARLAPAAEASGAPVERLDGVLAPGLFDIQINGGGGVLFNQEPDAGGLARIGAAHRAFGVTAFLPTLVTDAPDVMARACDAVLAHLGRDGVAGVHLEGPHIAPAKRGVHAERFVRPLDDHTLHWLGRLREAKVPTLVTLAPETVPPAEIARLAAMGVVVAIGHSAATAEQVEAALDAGAACFTHLYNAMSPMESRAPGVVGAAINSDAHCSLIADGVHVDDRMAALAIRARPRADRMILVSDAMPTIGGPDRYELYGETIALVDGVLRDRRGALAGAHVDLAACVARAHRALGVDLAGALAMATRHPARLMGLEREIGAVAPGSRNLVLLDQELRASRID